MSRPTLETIKIGPDEARAVIDHHKEMMKHHVERGDHEQVKWRMARVEEIWMAMPPSPSF